MLRRETVYIYDIGRRRRSWQAGGKRETPRRFMGVMKDMKMLDVTVEKTRNRVRWREMICCGDP